MAQASIRWTAAKQLVVACPGVVEVPIRLEDPIVAAALITGASVAVAIVNGLFQTICTWMQNRSKKPPANKPRPKQRKKRHRPPEGARPPPQDDVAAWPPRRHRPRSRLRCRVLSGR
jgi:hypothetical protein